MSIDVSSECVHIYLPELVAFTARVSLGVSTGVVLFSTHLNASNRFCCFNAGCALMFSRPRFIVEMLSINFGLCAPADIEFSCQPNGQLETVKVDCH